MQLGKSAESGTLGSCHGTERQSLRMQARKASGIRISFVGPWGTQEGKTVHSPSLCRGSSTHALPGLCLRWTCSAAHLGEGFAHPGGQCR